MNESIYKSIKTLPPLDDTIIQIQQICCNPDSSLEDLIKVVQSDPMLTANILRSANSPLYGFSREITDVNRAITLFGMATIRGFALSGAIKRTFTINLSPYGISSDEFLNIASTQNALIFNWYGKVDRELLNVLSPASFMMDIGKIIISIELIENNQTKAFQERLKLISTPKELSDLEIEMVGVSNEEVTAKIFEQWNLEGEMIDAIFYSNNPENASEHIKPYSIALKVVKSTINIFGIFTDTNIKQALEILNTYELEESIFINAIDKVKR